jgi:hypothetical protein
MFLGAGGGATGTGSSALARLGASATQVASAVEQMTDGTRPMVLR